MKDIGRLYPGDQVAIVSLSDGRLNQEFQIKRLIENLGRMGLNVFFPKNSRKSFQELFGVEGALLRAEDLKEIFEKREIKAVFAAIGGVDTYRTLPFLLSDSRFIAEVEKSPKIFSGFSDTTVNHLMFYKLGMRSFYGPNALSDIAELGGEILPYTLNSIKYFFADYSEYEIFHSPVWYEERDDFTINQVGKKRVEHKETNGYDVITGTGIVTGELLGGCIETLFCMISPEATINGECYTVCEQYGVFPSRDEWTNKVIFLESSASKVNQETLFNMLKKLNDRGIFEKAKGVIFGKPQNGGDYYIVRTVLYDFFGRYLEGRLPVMYNVNFGHSFPRCILPYGAKVLIDLSNKRIKIIEKTLN